MKTRIRLVAYILLICICIGIFAGCCSTSESTSGNYKWYIKIYTPEGVIEGPGHIIITSNSGIVNVEIDGIRYKVGSQNVLARKLPSE